VHPTICVKSHSSNPHNAFLRHCLGLRQFRHTACTRKRLRHTPLSATHLYCKSQPLRGVRVFVGKKIFQANNLYSVVVCFSFTT
jgi:hypothetical protein